MARVEVPMPQMGESIAEGTVSVWLKKVGDTVERDEPIMEISTDKVDAEIPSPTAGRWSRSWCRRGRRWRWAPWSPTWRPKRAPPRAAASRRSRACRRPPSASRRCRRPEQPEAEDAAPRSRGTATAAARRPWPRAEGGDSLEERLRRSHAAGAPHRRGARGELSEVQGSGRMGRVTKDDILAYVEERKQAPAPASGENGAGRAAARRLRAGKRHGRRRRVLVGRASTAPCSTRRSPSGPATAWSR
jgi:pyruvate dehydrogenase E2 component (dihydrolipoamide acetyltransferase)